MATKKKEIKQETLFTKQQILASKKYFESRDVLGALLADGKQYTCAQVDSALRKYMKGKVK